MTLPPKQQTSVWSIFNKVPDSDTDKINMMNELNIGQASPVRIGANLQIAPNVADPVQTRRWLRHLRKLRRRTRI